MNLADDARTLSMMGEATFRQKGEALLSQFRRNYVSEQMRWLAMMQAQSSAPFGLAGQQAATGFYSGIVGSIWPWPR